MATLYPGGIDGTAQLQNPIATNTLDNPDHAVLHTNENGAIIAVENTVGTTLGTNVLKGFAAGDFPLRINANTGAGTLQQTVTGTFNQSTFGSATLLGGTVNNIIGTFNQSIFGSATLLGGTVNAVTGTINNAVIGTSAITGGTSTSQTINTPTFSTAAVTSPAIKRFIGGTSLGGNFTGTSSSYVDVTGLTVTGTTTVTSNIRVSVMGNVQNNSAARIVQLQILRGVSAIRQAYAQCQSTSLPATGDLSYYDQSLAAGTYTYKVQISGNNGNADIIVALSGMQLILEAESS